VEETAADLAAQYGVPQERVVSLVERLKQKKAG
jgi:sugar-specific transcriptional regulator TrmB